MSPKTLVRRWLTAFNARDADALALLYRDDATNRKPGADPITGKDAIHAAFAADFAAGALECLPDNLFEEGEWSVLEWHDATGVRGASFFHVIDGKVALQRNY
jgi:ketosteroid isomerase-like protein